MNHTIVINSIGTATPGASKVLSDVLKVPQDYMLKLLYNAPSVLFQKVDKDTAAKAEDTLTKLGLDVSVCAADDTIDLTSEQVDISVGIENVLDLPKVIEQLATFLGCKRAEVLNLLMKEPGIVLGNVSAATAEALKKRVDANIHYSNPRKDLYTLILHDDVTDAQRKKIEKIAKSTASKQQGTYIIEEVPYELAQQVWRTYQAENRVRLLNQSHQTAHLTLSDFEVDNRKHVAFLMEEVGMPMEILPDVHQALPITLFENINRKQAAEIADTCIQLGIGVEIKKDFGFHKHLKVDDIKDAEAVAQVLSQFIPEENLPQAGVKCWESQSEIPSLIARYLQAQLEQLDCNPEITD